MPFPVVEGQMLLLRYNYIESPKRTFLLTHFLDVKFDRRVLKMQEKIIFKFCRNFLFRIIFQILLTFKQRCLKNKSIIRHQIINSFITSWKAARNRYFAAGRHCRKFTQKISVTITLGLSLDQTDFTCFSSL